MNIQNELRLLSKLAKEQGGTGHFEMKLTGGDHEPDLAQLTIEGARGQGIVTQHQTLAGAIARMYVELKQVPA